MSEKSRLIGLMAKREAAEIAGARRAFVQTLTQHQAAEAMAARLSALLEQRRAHGSGQMSVADLRQHRTLSAQLAAESERNRAQAAKLQEEVTAAMAELSRKSHRKQVLDDAAKTARRAEAEEREQRAEAGRPALRKR